mgnify:CR=1 FL=1|jgi:excisionase family DNA binding protein
MKSSKKTLTVKEVAEILSMPCPTVYDHLSSGTIPGKIKIGRNVRVISDVFWRWFEDAQDGDAA